MAQPWHGKVYMNPPYGRALPKWVEKLCAEFGAGHITEAIALLPSRTDTRWFRSLRNYPRCFLHGRVKFKGFQYSAPFPSMLIYMGQHGGTFVDVFSSIGDTYVKAPASELGGIVRE